MKINNIVAREILDSRGNPTIEVDTILDDGSLGRFSVPSGASTGSNEAHELRDKEKRYNGLGVLKAVNNVNGIIRDNLIGKEIKQDELDKLLIELDDTENKGNLGANSLLGVSASFLKAMANSKKMPLFKYVGDNINLPMLMVNIINGGKHSDNNIDFQEFMIVPMSSTVKERIQVASEVFHALKILLKEDNLSTAVGDEGGFAPNLKDNYEVLNYIMKAIVEAGYKPGKDVNIALDVAASELYHNNKYYFDNNEYTKSELINYYGDLINRYPIISIEDPTDESDWNTLIILTEKLKEKVQIVGDDTFTTNKKYLQYGIDNKCATAILIKLNQIGTVSEALETINLAKENNYNVIISHRSGETTDTTIAHLAVGLGTNWIKTGSMSRGERIEKYNELMRIEELIAKNEK